MLMKKLFGIVILLAVIFAPTNFSEAAETVAVIPFENKSARQTPDAERMLDGVRENVETDIVQTDRFTYPDRVKLQQVLDEIKLQHTGLFDAATIARYGKFVGAKYLVLGTLTGLSQKGKDYVAHLSLRMIEVETATIYLAGRGSGTAKTAEDALEKAAEDALSGKRGMLTMLARR